MGYVSQAHQPAKEDSTVVTMLKNLGAVIYCKTNVPTTLMVSTCFVRIDDACKADLRTVSVWRDDQQHVSILVSRCRVIAQTFVSVSEGQ